MIPWIVRIIGGGGEIIEDVVFAKTAKHALQATISNLMDRHPCWGWAGWQIQISQMQEPFIVGAAIKNRNDL